MYDSIYITSGKAELWGKKKQELPKMDRWVFSGGNYSVIYYTTIQFAKTHRTEWHKAWTLCKLYQLKNDKNEYRNNNVEGKQRQCNIKVIGILETENPLNKTRKRVKI